MDKEKKILVLTGASRGIGHATVRCFNDAGWRILTCSRQVFDARCPWPGGKENHVEADFSDSTSTARAIDEIKDKLDGKLHALVNNAGISPKSANGQRLNTFETELKTWYNIFQVNFYTPLLLAKAFQSELVAAKGAIVNTTSVAGSRVHPFAGTGYATSKAALATLTREMAYDFGTLGVRVNAIAPGEVETEMLSKGFDQIISGLPLGRIGQPSEVADAIFFLGSPNSSYITGAGISINGGQLV